MAEVHRMNRWINWIGMIPFKHGVPVCFCKGSKAENVKVFARLYTTLGCHYLLYDDRGGVALSCPLIHEFRTLTYTDAIFACQGRCRLEHRMKRDSEKTLDLWRALPGRFLRELIDRSENGSLVIEGYGFKLKRDLGDFFETVMPIDV